MTDDTRTRATRPGGPLTRELIHQASAGRQALERGQLAALAALDTITRPYRQADGDTAADAIERMPEALRREAWALHDLITQPAINGPGRRKNSPA